MNLKMKNGHIVEFRLHIDEMDQVATGKGHKFYTERRSLEIKHDLTEEERRKIKQLFHKESELYEQAWKQILNK